MADIAPITPVADQIKPPNMQQGLASLSSILGLSQKQIQIKQQQAQLQTQQAEAQQAQQKNGELQALAAFTSKAAQDPDYLNADGSANVQKFQQGAMQVAPVYGQAYIGNASTNFNTAVENRKALLGLSNEQRATAGQYLGAVAADPNASVDSFRTAIEQARGVSKDPGYQSAVDSMLLHAPQTAGMTDAQASSAIRNFARNVAVKVNAVNAPLSTPTESPVQTKGGIVQNQTNPLSPMGMGEIPGSAVANAVPPGVTQGPGGMPIKYGAGGSGLPSAQGNSAPQGPMPSRLPALQQPASAAPAAQWQNYNAQIQAAGQLITAARNAANDPMNGVSATRFRNQQILDLIPDAATGPGMRLLNTLASRLPGSSGDAYQDIEHYTALNSAALAQKMGVPNTNLGSETAAAAAGNVERNPGALAEITKTNDALNTAFDLFNRGLAKVSNNGSDVSRVPAYQQAFGSALDINAIRWADAHRRNDTQEMDRLQKLPGFNLKAVQTSLRTLKALADTGDLPNGG